uniref:Uncharacterized protein n=1 Tax=Tanacetum cinerariifolium TaxID=118510 RepID=A0A699GH77_TANCI|nr:hypothetical protein [Tanacetum cinerariifolium]
MAAGATPLRQLRSPVEVIRQFTPNWFAATMGTGILSLALAQLPGRALGVVFRRSETGVRPCDRFHVLRYHSHGLGYHNQWIPQLWRGALGRRRCRGGRSFVVDRCGHGACLRRPHSLPDVHAPAAQHRPDDGGLAAAGCRCRGCSGERRAAGAAPAGWWCALHSPDHRLRAVGIFGASGAQHSRDSVITHGPAQTAARKHGGIELAGARTSGHRRARHAGARRRRAGDAGAVWPGRGWPRGQRDGRGERAAAVGTRPVVDDAGNPDYATLLQGSRSIQPGLVGLYLSARRIRGHLAASGEGARFAVLRGLRQRVGSGTGRPVAGCRMAHRARRLPRQPVCVSLHCVDEPALKVHIQRASCAARASVATICGATVGAVQTDSGLGWGISSTIKFGRLASMAAWAWRAVRPASTTTRRHGRRSSTSPSMATPARTAATPSRAGGACSSANQGTVFHSTVCDRATAACARKRDRSTAARGRLLACRPIGSARPHAEEIGVRHGVPVRLHRPAREPPARRTSLAARQHCLLRSGWRVALHHQDPAGASRLLRQARPHFAHGPNGSTVRHAFAVSLEAAHRRALTTGVDVVDSLRFQFIQEHFQCIGHAQAAHNHESLGVTAGLESDIARLAVHTRHQVAGTCTGGYGMGHIDKRLRRLAGRHMRDDLVACGVDHVDTIAVFETNVHFAAVVRRPCAMRQGAGRYRRHELWLITGGIDLDDIFSANCHVGSYSGSIFRERQVVGNKTGVDDAFYCQRRHVDAGDLANVLVCHPDFFEIRRELIKARYHERQFAVGMEHHHARTTCCLDTAFFLEGDRIDDRDVIFAAYYDPDFATVCREKSFVGRAPDIGHTLDFVGGRVDEGHGIGTIRYCNQACAVTTAATANVMAKVSLLNLVSCMRIFLRVCIGGIVTCAMGCLVALQPGAHDIDFVLLFDDDALRQVAQFAVVTVDQDGLGHIDRTLVVRNHHAHEVVRWVPGHRRAPHAVIHDRHGIVRQRRIGPVATGDKRGRRRSRAMVAGMLRRDCGGTAPEHVKHVDVALFGKTKARVLVARLLRRHVQRQALAGAVVVHELRHRPAGPGQQAPADQFIAQLAQMRRTDLATHALRQPGRTTLPADTRALAAPYAPGAGQLPRRASPNLRHRSPTRLPGPPPVPAIASAGCAAAWWPLRWAPGPVRPAPDRTGDAWRGSVPRRRARAQLPRGALPGKLRSRQRAPPVAGRRHTRAGRLQSRAGSFHDFQRVYAGAAVHQAAQLFAGAREPRHDGPDGDAERRRHFFITHVFQPDHQQDRALFFSKQAQRGIQLAHLDADRAALRHSRHRRVIVERLGVQRAAPHLIDAHIVHDRKQPGTRVRAGLQRGALGPAAFERVLHQVIGRGALPHERARVAPQPRDTRQQLGAGMKGQDAHGTGQHVAHLDGGLAVELHCRRDGRALRIDRLGRTHDGDAQRPHRAELAPHGADGGRTVVAAVKGAANPGQPRVVGVIMHDGGMFAGANGGEVRLRHIERGSGNSRGGNADGAGQEEHQVGGFHGCGPVQHGTAAMAVRVTQHREPARRQDRRRAHQQPCLHMRCHDQFRDRGGKGTGHHRAAHRLVGRQAEGNLHGGDRHTHVRQRFLERRTRAGTGFAQNPLRLHQVGSRQRRPRCPWMIGRYHDNQLILPHRFDGQGGFVDVALDETEIGATQQDGLRHAVGIAHFQSQVDDRISLTELHEQTRQPVTRDRLAGVDCQRAAPHLAQFRQRVFRYARACQRALRLRQENPPGVGEFDAPPDAMEQCRAVVLFQGLDR